MKTPVYDELHADWSLAIKSAEARTLIESNREVLALLKTIRNPTKAVKEMITKLSE